MWCENITKLHFKPLKFKQTDSIQGRGSIKIRERKQPNLGGSDMRGEDRNTFVQESLDPCTFLNPASGGESDMSPKM
jgi:hypothetical protein